MQQPILILGAGSGIAQALARAFASRGRPLYLAARRPEALEKFAQRLREDWPDLQADLLAFDALDFASHRKFYESLDPAPETLVAAFGVLGDQEESQADWAQAEQVMATNYLGAASILEVAATAMERRGSGCLVGISSVAGERARARNYIYGSSKAAMTAYLDGLRHRLWRKGVRVVAVKPGFVATAMTAGMDLPKALTATPEQVARATLAAIDGGKAETYVSFAWRWIARILRNLPRWLFHRTSF